MAAKQDGGQAFPEITSGRLEPENVAGYSHLRLTRAGGMSLRDYFAAQVLGLAAHDLVAPMSVAARAYAVADAMIAERKK